MWQQGSQDTSIRIGYCTLEQFIHHAIRESNWVTVHGMVRFKFLVVKSVYFRILFSPSLPSLLLRLRKSYLRVSPENLRGISPAHRSPFLGVQLCISRSKCFNFLLPGSLTACRDFRLIFHCRRVCIVQRCMRSRIWVSSFVAASSSPFEASAASTKSS